jgi:hypothetical protein
MKSESRIKIFNAALLSHQKALFLKHWESDFTGFNYLNHPAVSLASSFAADLDPGSRVVFASLLQKRGQMEAVLPWLGLSLSGDERLLLERFEKKISEATACGASLRQVEPASAPTPSLKTVVRQMGVNFKPEEWLSSKYYPMLFQRKFGRLRMTMGLGRSRYGPIRVWYRIVDFDGIQLNLYNLSPLSMVGLSSQTDWEGQCSSLDTFCAESIKTMEDLGQWADAWDSNEARKELEIV